MQSLPSQNENFKLHNQLERDTFMIKSLDLCDVLLMNDSRYPWLILVPRLADCEELFHLTQNQQQNLMAEITFSAEKLSGLFKPDKVNIGMLGNKVRQLHIHVIARFEDDATWPNPVWGVGEAQPYGNKQNTLHKIQCVFET